MDIIAVKLGIEGFFRASIVKTAAHQKAPERLRSVKNVSLPFETYLVEWNEIRNKGICNNTDKLLYVFRCIERVYSERWNNGNISGFCGNRLAVHGYLDLTVNHHLEFEKLM